MDKSDLAYIAGFFDGEGRVYFSRNRIIIGVSERGPSPIEEVVRCLS